MRSFRKSGESACLKKRKNYQFIPIKQTSSFEALKTLPDLASSKQLTPDAIFNGAQRELKQVKLDSLKINECVLQDISSEAAQTDKIEHQLQVSMRKLHRHYRRIIKKREILENSASRNIECCSAAINKIEASLGSLKDLSDFLVSSIYKKDAELPFKNRLFSDQEINRQHYPLLFEALSEYELSQDSQTDNGSAISARSAAHLCKSEPQILPGTFGQDHEVLCERQSDLKSAIVQYEGDINSLDSVPLQVSTNGSFAKQHTRLKTARTSIPEVMLMPQFRKASNASVITTYEQACHPCQVDDQEVFGKLAGSLHKSLDIRK
ncbi:LAQU0S04e04500g1_1 [Lachancea quebecensis]|uniref:LAQU0S04e04500g1_1 n=1 Tax=Lachancea quebecensis TaxID=1654605 RepID=A0A0P1KQR4_9SACH|nr:LAQU0S04e04500g1_1 [Lachancea quebecensis]